MKPIIGFVFTFLAAVCSAQATVEVAFFEVRMYDGRVLQLEENGLYAHVAIRTPLGWMHSRPGHGVEVAQSLKDIGNAKEVLVSRWTPDIEANIALSLIGVPYDNEFNWDDRHSTYCSKLVAQLLGVPPNPMQFTGPYWEKLKTPHPSEGKPGISPDELYRELINLGYASRKAGSCVAAIE